MKHTHHHSNFAKCQTGAALVVSLMILLILTLIGVSGMQGTIMQEKMASNTKDRSLAFQSTESAVRDAETYIESLVTIGGFDGTTGLFNIDDAEPDYLLASTWSSDEKSIQTTLVPGTASAPRYFIKKTGTLTGTQGSMNMSGYGGNKSLSEVTTFRITARGIGATQDDDGVSTEVIISSHYGRIL